VRKLQLIVEGRSETAARNRELTAPEIYDELKAALQSAGWTRVGGASFSRYGVRLELEVR
jgi:hypothetical protein